MERDTLIAWLNDAHAMETQLIPVLREHARDVADMPEMRKRIERHVTETQQHADRMQQAVELLGSTNSTMKDAMGTLMGTVQSVSTEFFSDELVKNALTDFAAESFEIAAYTALIAAADELGETEVVNLCRQNLKEDQAMAAWLEQQLPIIAKETMARTASR